MNFRTIFTILFTIIITHSLLAQRPMIHGNVFWNEPCGDHFHKVPLVGAHVVWLGTTTGVATDDNGHFHMHPTAALPQKLVISYIGFRSDTVEVLTLTQVLDIILEPEKVLDEVVITGRQAGAHYSSMEPILTQKLTAAELQRGACCNLAEAFETNVSVDVSYSDAISGAKQIQMLGLAGIYSQIMVENLPAVRGLGQPFGLSYIPGPWMESISISKGAASVINGYESFTGQINVELKKPQGPEALHYNAFAGSDGRLESSLMGSVNLNGQWSAMLLAHAEGLNSRLDHNNNGFLDHPMVKKYNIIGRFSFEDHGKLESQFGFKILQEEREGGQEAFFANKSPWGSSEFFGFGMNTTRYEAFAKTRFPLQLLPDASMGAQVNFTHHDQQSHYGQKPYNGTQNSLFANLLLQSALFNHNHKIISGTSFILDHFNESLQDSSFTRREVVPGIFAEYSYHSHEALTVILAGRMDFHNLYGNIFTPRMHTHFNITEHFTVRASAGRAFRVPNPIAENTGLLVSNRRFVVTEDIRPERAWNYGGSLVRRFHLLDNDASFAVEYYRTDFSNQLIVDIDSDSRQVIFSNLQGKSFSNNYQAELRLQPARTLEMTAAVRYTDVQLTINDELRSRPFVNRYRGLLSGSWASVGNSWQVDVTAQFNGPSRIPALPAQFNMPAESPFYTNLLAQITYRWRGVEVYLGAENLTNFRQENPILIPENGNPFSDGFDGAMIWGPIMGRKFHLGVRYSLKR